jgi:type II secretory pathway pseudopilin PulG
MKNTQLKGFTIAELLVVMILTSISISLSYTTLTHTQKLFNQYRNSLDFIKNYTSLQTRFNYESLYAERIVEEQENRFTINRDGINSLLEIKSNVILLIRNNRCDTFHFQVKNIAKKYEPMQNPVWSNKLLTELQFETEYGKQKFVMTLSKQHSASLKLKLDQY